MNVVTWNMQGATGSGQSKWTEDVKRLFVAGTDVACLQECGVPPASATVAPPPPWLGPFVPPVGVNVAYLVWNLGTSTRPSYVYIFWILSDPNGNRNNLALASKVAPNALVYVNPGLPGGRPSIGVQLPYGFGSVCLFTLHAFSGGGQDAPNLLANINAVGGSWFAAGDYNRDPNTWGPGPGHAPPPNALLCPHNVVPTHPGSGTNLDYAFKSPGPAVFGEVFSNFVVSDHYPVGYQI